MVPLPPPLHTTSKHSPPNNLRPRRDANLWKEMPITILLLPTRPCRTCSSMHIYQHTHNHLPRPHHYNWWRLPRRPYQLLGQILPPTHTPLYTLQRPPPSHIHTTTSTNTSYMHRPLSMLPPTPLQHPNTRHPQYLTRLLRPRRHQGQCPLTT